MNQYDLAGVALVEAAAAGKPVMRVAGDFSLYKWRVDSTHEVLQEQQNQQ